jgi:Calcineurin-like phosphoesterase
MIDFRIPSLKRRERPRVPDGVRIYAIGDIHGRADLLDILLERIDVHAIENPVAQTVEVFLGDYVDRGPASRQVIDRLVVRNQTHKAVFIKGNHEVLMTSFITMPTMLNDWQSVGGLETLISYGITPAINADSETQVRLSTAFGEALSESHRQFLKNLTPSFTCGDFFFVHAGIKPGIPLTLQKEEDLLWIRQEFLDCEDDFSKVIVHGHTPVLRPDIRYNRINIDTGAYATGQLTCLVLEGDRMDIV